MARFLCRYLSTAKLGGEAGTASPAEAGGTSCSSLCWMVFYKGIVLRLNIDTLLNVDPRVKPEDDGAG